MTIFERYITQHIDSADIFSGLANFFQFFSLHTFLTYGPLKTVWADPATAVRVRVKLHPVIPLSV
jgi:hypothetical protein